MASSSTSPSTSSTSTKTVEDAIANIKIQQQQKNEMCKTLKQMLNELMPLCSELIDIEGLRVGSSTGNKKMSNGSSRMNSAPIVRQLREMVASMGCDLLKFNRVDPKTMWAGTFCTPIHEQQDLFEMSIFGFRHIGHHIPLHDHPQMFGFVRPLCGRFRISSYTWLDPADEQKIRAQKSEMLERKENSSVNGHSCGHKILRPARYEGQLIMSTPPKNCSAFPNVAILEPNNTNVHKIEALEDGSAFFDLLVPGYHSERRTCTYYDVLNEGKELAVGDIVWLEGNDETPAHFTMQRIL